MNLLTRYRMIESFRNSILLNLFILQQPYFTLKFNHYPIICPYGILYLLFQVLLDRFIECDPSYPNSLYADTPMAKAR